MEPEVDEDGNEYEVENIGHREAIQDLTFLDKYGLLLSCSYDKTVCVWDYFGRFICKFEKKVELKCLDYVSDSGTMLVGTNSHEILTHDLVPLLNQIDL